MLNVRAIYDTIYVMKGRENSMFTNIIDKILRVFGAIIFILIVGIALGVLLGNLLLPLKNRDVAENNEPGPDMVYEKEPVVDTTDVSLTEQEILKIANTASINGFPAVVFSDALKVYTKSMIDSESSFSIDWEYGWNGEVDTAASDVNQNVTCILSLHLRDEEESDGYEDNAMYFYFVLDTESYILVPSTGVMLEDGDSTPYTFAYDELQEMLLGIVSA